MSYFYWGEKNNPNHQNTKKVRVDDCNYGHSPDKRGERKDKYSKQPIDVRKSWGGYKVIDGNDRLYYAKERGDDYIEAVEWD